MDEEIKLLKLIDKYLNGQLFQEEEIDFWTALLKYPKAFDWLIIELYAKEYFRQTPIDL